MNITQRDFDMDIEMYFSICREKLHLFKKKVMPMKSVEAGITLTEGFSYCMMAEYFNINMLLESGTARGMSTEIFARYFDFPIKTIDLTSLYGAEVHISTKRRLSKYKNVECLTGDSKSLIPQIISENKDKKIGLFLDGPKGIPAINLSKECFSNEHVLFVGIHDTCHKERYHLMDCWEDTFLYSDDSRFEEFREIDNIATVGGIGFSKNNIII